MVVQEDTIFVCGMTVETTESEINEHFGAIGIIKVIVHQSMICIVDFK